MSLPSPPNDGEIGAGLEAGARHRTWPSACRARQHTRGIETEGRGAKLP